MTRSGFDKSSARGLRPPGVLRQTPVDPFEQIAELRRRDRHRPVRGFARNGRWPDEASALQPLGEKAHPLAVVPQDLEQATAPPAEHEQMAVVGIALEGLLHQHRQAIEAFAHVGVPGRQPHLRAARNRDHRRRAFASTVTIALTAEASTGPANRIRAPLANSISTATGVAGDANVASGPCAIATAANAGAVRTRSQSSCRQRNNWLT